MWHPLWALASRVLRHECPIRCWSFFPSQGMLEEGREKQLDTRKNFQVIVNTGGPGVWGQHSSATSVTTPSSLGLIPSVPSMGPTGHPFPQNWRWSHSSAVDRGSSICLSLKQVYFLLICLVLPCVLGSQVQSECSLHAPCFHLPLLEMSAMPHLGLWGTFGFKFHLIQIPSLHLARAPVCHPHYAGKPGMGREASGSPRGIIWGQMLPQASALCRTSYYRPHRSFHLGSSQAELYISQHLGSQPLWPHLSSVSPSAKWKSQKLDFRDEEVI